MEDYIEFDFSQLVLSCIEESLKKPNEEEVICVCKDASGMQAIASIDAVPTKTDGVLRLRNIATNPRNIKSKLNKYGPGVRGASFHLDHYIEKIAAANKCNVVLNPLGDTVEFYEKCGYVPDGNGAYIKKLY